MKKLVGTILSSAILMFCIGSFTYANEAEVELDSITEHIVEEVNTLFANDLGREINLEDVDYNEAYKIYVGANIFSEKSNDADALEEILEATGYIYEIPIYVGKSTIIVNIAKGLPLDEDSEYTEQEKEQVLKNVGKWHVTAVKYYKDEIVSYNSVIEEELNEIPDELILVGGLPHFRYAVALIPDESGEVSGLLPLSEVPGIEVIESYRSSKSSNVYDYKTTKEYINDLPEIDPELSTGYGFSSSKDNYNSYVLGVIAIAGVALLVFYSWRKGIKKRMI